ncbi:hypothetical protein [Klebsiella pneumoniae]
MNKTFGPGTANEHTVQWWFKKFCRGDESLEDEQHGGRQLEVDNNQLRAIVEADSLTTTREVAKELYVRHSMIIRHLKQIGKVKKLHKWVPHELTENQKIIVLKHCLCSVYIATTKYFSINCDMQ